MTSRLVVLLTAVLLFAIFVPQSLGQVVPAIEPELARVGFEEGAETIPLDGSEIPVGPGDQIWIRAFSDIEVTHGVDGREPQILEMSNADSLMIQIPIVACCDRSLTYLVSAVSTSPLPGGREVQRAVLRVVGPHNSQALNPSAVLIANTIQIRPSESDELGLTTQLALIQEGVERASLVGDFGAINYSTILIPGGQVSITYDVTELGPIGGLLHIVLESPRVITAGSNSEDLSLTLRKNGTVVSTAISVDTITLASQMRLPNLNEPGDGGDTPIQFGLHYLHVFSEGGASGDINFYLPVFVLENDSFTLLDHSLSPRDPLRITLTESSVDGLSLVAASSTFGVTTTLLETNLDLPITRLRLFNGPLQLFSYELEFSSEVQQSQHEGITYLLGNSRDDSIQILQILVNNFTLVNYEIRGKTSNEVGFPEDIEITTLLNIFEVSVVDELNRDIREGTITIEKSGEAYVYPLVEQHELRLEDGTYSITYTLNDNEIVRDRLEASVRSAGEFVLSASTIILIDLIITAAILGEIVVVALLGLRALLGKRQKEEDLGFAHVS